MPYVAKVSNVSSNASETRVFIFLNTLRVGKSTARVTLSVVQALALKYPFRCVNHVELDWLPLFHSADALTLTYLFLRRAYTACFHEQSKMS